MEIVFVHAVYMLFVLCEHHSMCILNNKCNVGSPGMCTIIVPLTKPMVKRKDNV